MADTLIPIKKIKVAGLSIYPATIIDAIKDAKGNAETNADYDKTLRQILEAIKADIKALSDLGLTAEDIALIATNKAAIATLNGTASEDGSVAKAVATAVANVVDDAPEAFDTLKEIAAWIANPSNKTAAQIVADVTTNKDAIGEEAKEAEYYTTWEEYIAASEAEGWAPDYTLEREFNDDPADAGEKLKSEAKEASGLYKKIEEAKTAAIAAQHSKTTVTAGTTAGSISVDGGADIVICTLSVEATKDTTEYADVF